MSWPNDVSRSDLRVEFYRGSGAGGQNRNKRDTACRITHLPTGTVATAQEHRTQDRNRKAAFSRLADTLVPLMRQAARTPAEALETRTIRTYHYKRGTVVDRRVPGVTFPLKRILDGKLWEIHKHLVPGSAPATPPRDDAQSHEAKR